MKVLITGATGFLGSWVAKSAIEAGHSVRALVRDSRSALSDGVEPVQGMLNDVPGLERALDGVEAVVHLAGKVSRQKKDAAAMHLVHVEGTRRLLAAMKHQGVRRLVVASTSGTIGLARKRRATPATENITPDFELLGQFPYYTSKLYQEHEVLARQRANEVDAVILNPSLLLGPGDRRLSSTLDVLDILNGRVPMLTEGTLAMVDVRDCAPVFVQALSAGRPGHRYLLNGSNMSVRTFAQRVAVAGDVMAPTFKIPSRWALRGAKLMSGFFETLDREPPVDPVAVEMGTLHWDVNAEKAQRELGFQSRDPQLTIEATVRDLEARGLFRRSARR